ncbi:MAG: hypothetical protein RLZZ385_2522 [Pseudomonadota bacterium]|jgi:chorismate mutase
MTAEPIPQDLLQVREQIDQIDAELVELLAKRFALTYQVGRLKARNRLEAVDPAREAGKLAALKSLSEERNLNPELVTGIFTAIMAEVVRNHRKLQAEL